MCNNLELITALYVAMKRQVEGGSGAMEPAAARCCIQSLELAGIRIDAFATDRSTAMKTLMSSEFPHIIHQFDIWKVICSSDLMP